ncbi:MAG: bifunctional glutamate N-acetyltransferase/amino-acid acetyltransferase ArgJ [Actinomycetota bacterium]|nr:bifunctional glutamate N-acetyltransferase/amino-acid acetyltransferase ArgJ [Actinomycetota bacterium]
MAVTWPDGVRSSGVASGIKPNGALDLGVLTLDRPGSWAATFTKNGAAAAPVEWSRALVGRPLRGVVVNSGNANACTGAAGAEAVRATAEAAAGLLSCSPQEIGVASTGPIGVHLPVDNLLRGLPAAVRQLTRDTGPFSEAILTTDTRSKLARVTADGFEVTGVAKGAAMLAPNMATMLAFVATDAAVDGIALQQVLTRAVRRSFDRISVDACESTNDSVFLLSSGTAHGVDEESFAAAVEDVCRDLAEQMVRDAEGGSKIVRIRVAGAEDEDAAVALAKGVAGSILWRAAVHGGDPNWGRVAAALGAVDRKLDLCDVVIRLGPEVVFRSGEPAAPTSAAARALAGDEVLVHCTVGSGGAGVEVLTTDLSPVYVTLNAAGTS